MKIRRAITRHTSFEALEGRCVLSAVAPLTHSPGRSAVEHSASMPAVVKSSEPVVTAISNTDVNWSGYAIPTSSNAVSYVAGLWKVPTVDPKSSGYSATWVGIDGYSSNTVEQIGTEQDVVGGHVAYSAWFEMYPSDSVTISNFTVKAGDVISHRSDTTRHIRTLCWSSAIPPSRKLHHNPNDERGRQGFCRMGRRGAYRRPRRSALGRFRDGDIHERLCDDQRIDGTD